MELILEIPVILYFLTSQKRQPQLAGLDHSPLAVAALVQAVVELQL
jgi:hypothetical protein